MKLITSLLLGSAAAFSAVSGASAADLPSRSKGPAVEYVRICDTYGAGYFYIPGTDTCLKISGYARADYGVRNVTNQFGPVGGVVPGFTPLVVPVPGVLGVVNIGGISAAARNTSAFAALGGLELDARTQTSWGTLRGFIRYETFFSNFNLGGITGPNAHFANLDKAYVQFAGITAGRAQSFFDFYGDAYPLDISRGSDVSTQMLAYTASFGGGFSATISIEDPVARRRGIGASEINQNVLGVTGPLDDQFRTAAYGGSKVPDIVAQLRVAQSWGTAQASGAFHQINTVSSTAIGAPKASGTGWAVQAGIAINLPMLAAGDEIYVQGAYARGARSYLGIDGAGLGDRSNALRRNDFDAIAVATDTVGGYHVEQGRGYNVQAGIKHYWAPNLRSTLWAAYTTWNYGNLARSNSVDEFGYGNGKEFMIGAQLIWTPVKNLDLTLDASYQHLKQNVNLFDSESGLVLLLPAGSKKDGNAFTGRIRIQRSF